MTLVEITNGQQALLQMQLGTKRMWEPDEVGALVISLPTQRASRLGPVTFYCRAQLGVHRAHGQVDKQTRQRCHRKWIKRC
jgi:hypothetical protein